MRAKTSMRNAISLLFLLSGVTGLVYEVLWAKYLALYLGNTAQAHTIVLATFMGGLALGNALLGPWADRVSNRLRFYGWLELGIGFWGLTSPLLLSLLSDTYVAMAKHDLLTPLLSVILRVSLCMGVLLLPTMLMGGTLPTLSRFATLSLSQMESTVSWLYFLNSAGAVGGAILAGFFLIPAYGLDLSTTFAAALNVAIGIVSLGLGARITQASGSPIGEAHPRETSLPPSRLHVRVIYGAVLVSGFVALAYEIAWIRLLALVLGSSTYSFSLMLAAFIAGIALGSFLITHRILPHIDSYLLFGGAEMGIALSIILTLPVYERLPYYFLLLGGVLNRTPATFYLYEIGKFLFCFALMLLPTTFLGMTLPLASRVVTQSVTQVGAKVGRVFSMNTLGNVLGAVLTGLLLLPALGIKTLIETGIVINLLMGSVVIWTAFQWGRQRKAVIVTTCFLTFLFYIFAVPAWDKIILSSGEFRSRRTLQYLGYGEYKEMFKNQSLLFYKDDSNATVTVVQEKSGDRFLKVNGKTDASSRGDLPTQLLSAHIPLLLNAEARQLLVVGMGSGITAGSALRYPIERLDLVEISAGVVQAAKFFQNYDALDDPRLHLHLEDAKTSLQLTPHRYDIIISEPSNPWMAGIGSLFSVEFYREAHTRLNAGGLMVQWFHTYEMDDDTLRLILRTFASVFEHVSLWSTVPADILLVGSSSPLSLDFKRLEERFDQGAVREDLRRLGIDSLPTVLSLQVASDATVRRLAGKGRLNEDRFPILEYEAPKAFFLGLVSGLIRAYDERQLSANGSSLYLTSYLERGNRPLSRHAFKDLVEFHRQYRGTSVFRAILNEWVRRYPQDPEALWALVRAEKAEGKSESALSKLELLISEEPHNLDYLEAAAELEIARYLQNRSYLNHISHAKALDYLHRLVELGVDHKARVYQKIAHVYVADRNLGTALSYLEKAAEYATEEGRDELQADHLWVQAAETAVEMEDLTRALAAVRKALAHNPGNRVAKRMLQQLLRPVQEGSSWQSVP
ncbi:MAG: fused MFS/spermidine synthase [Nitrospinae bacterium]|nr:fused MFS/spermidine synthase [Nitrospinota bacterium]